MEKINNYWIDKNNNRCNYDCHSEETAVKLSHDCVVTEEKETCINCKRKNKCIIFDITGKCFKYERKC